MKLGVNIDHVATLREARKGFEPEPAFAALVAEKSGADSIVAHLREDRRHIQDEDLVILKEILWGKLNMEMSISRDIVGTACRIKPHRATLVPEKRKELTTEGGLNITENFKRIEQAVKELLAAGIEVSLFIDPDKSQIEAAKKTGANSIEIHTGSYANSKNKPEFKTRTKEIELAASFAAKIGLRVFAGHGLNYENVIPIKNIHAIEELNIGHSIISRAVFVGLGQAVKEMKGLITRK